MADPPAAELRTRFIKKPEQKQQMLLLLALALKVARYNSQITINEAEKSTTAAATIHRILLRCHHLHLMFLRIRGGSRADRSRSHHSTMIKGESRGGQGGRGEQGGRGGGGGLDGAA